MRTASDPLSGVPQGIPTGRRQARTEHAASVDGEVSRKTRPIVIRKLGIEADQETAHELQLARKATARAAMQRIEQLREQPGTRPDSADRLHAIYDFRYRRAAQRAGLLGDEEEDLNERSLAWQRMVRDVLKTQRDELVRRRDAGSISDDVQHAVMRDLDLEDQRLDLT
jgi:CPA1 family monovalent cation:H+ antiporter